MRVFLEGGTAGFAACIRGALVAAGHAETRDPGCAEGAILLHGAADGTLEEMASTLVGRAAWLLDRLDPATARVVVATPAEVYGEGPGVCADCGRVRPSNRAAPARAPWDPRCPRCEGRLLPAPVREDEKVQPATPRAVLWLSREDLVLSWARQHGARGAAIRIPELFGGGADGGWAAAFAGAARQGLAVPVPEDGGATRDFLHRDDAAAALLAALGNPRASGGPLNVGTGRATALSAAAAALGAQASPTGRGGCEPRHLALDAMRFRHATGWRPTIEFASGL